LVNVNNLSVLRAALTRIEGHNACWDGTGELTLLKALEIYNAIPPNERHEHTGHYATIYGCGGWNRYYVNMATGDVTFSEHHATPANVLKAVGLGFALH
jgi:hypothetical protein